MLATRACSATLRRSVALSLRPTLTSGRAYTTEEKKEAPKSEAKPEQAATTDAAKPSAEQQKVEELTKKAAELEDKYRRALAETENVRLRGKREEEKAKTFAIQGFAKDLLEVADILKLAVDSVPAQKREELFAKCAELKSLHEGVSGTQTCLSKIFARHGLESVNPLNQMFDPNEHVALYEVPTPEKDKVGKIAAVQVVGYKLKERVLRPASVGVYKAQPQ